MSHLHQRKEKICLNCNAQLTGRYCQDCGQENVEPKESFGHLLKHFLEDLTHFDGKFFATLKPLLFRPGFLTKEYVAGRRASYINPIRMYLFISALFFLLLMTFFLHTNKKGAQVSPVSGSFSALGKTLESIDTITGGDSTVYGTLKDGTKIYDYNYPETVEAYDSIQNLLIEKDKDGAIERYFARKSLRSEQYNHQHPEEAKHLLKEKFYHSMPYMLFITLPLIALLLKLLYIRRKDFYYVSHIIFTLHFYCFVFILLLVSKAISELGYWGSIAGGILEVGIFIYLFIAMLRFYHQSVFKTFIKFSLRIILGLGFISVLTVLLLINSYLNVAS